jgi:transcriptional regulator of acetoin/glycerol metabolism
MELEILQQIWKHFVDTGELDPRIQPVVAESWCKCHRYGLDPWAGKGKMAVEAVFHSILEENKDLLDTALPIMHSVYEIVERSDGNSALMLACARLRHVAGTQWGNKKYMNMRHLEAMAHADIAG